jgi:hypothetical protein
LGRLAVSELLDVETSSQVFCPLQILSSVMGYDGGRWGFFSSWFMLRETEDYEI